MAAEENLVPWTSLTSASWRPGFPAWVTKEARV